MAIWHILTTSYPPYRGGLGFHSAHLAECLARRGDEVVVWSAFDPQTKEMVRGHPAAAMVQHHRISTQWDQQSFKFVEQQLIAGGGLLLVQYRPQVFPAAGAHQLVAFLRALRAQRRRQPQQANMIVGVMMHRLVETELSTGAGMSPGSAAGSGVGIWRWLRTWWCQNVRVLRELGRARQLIKHTDFIVVTSPRLASRLRWQAMGYPRLPAIWVMPVSSPVVPQAADVNIHNLRRAFLADRQLIVGTYSSFKEPEVLSVLTEVMVRLLTTHRHVIWLGFGRFSAEYFRFLTSKYPHLAERLLTAGEVNRGALSVHVAVCDVLFQPYYRGVNTQRASAMVVLDHAKPLVTTVGPDTEKIWFSDGAVRLHPWRDRSGFQASIAALAASPQLRAGLGRRGKRLYDEQFSWTTKQEILARVAQSMVAKPS